MTKKKMRPRELVGKIPRRKNRLKNPRPRRYNFSEMKFKLNKPKLKVYYWDICPHCRATVDFLKEKGVPFDALDIERQPPDVVKRVVDANGGVDWVVPTLEYGGKWRAGRRFDAEELSRDLKNWGLL